MHTYPILRSPVNKWRHINYVDIIANFVIYLLKNILKN